MKYLLFIVAFCSCNLRPRKQGKYYIKNFLQTSCLDSTVFFTPYFQSFGFKTEDIDTVEIIFYKKNSCFDTELNKIYFYPKSSNTYPGNENFIIIYQPSLYNGSAWDSLYRFFSYPNGLKPCSIDFEIILSGKDTFKISNIKTKEMYVNGHREITTCSLYSYVVNGVIIYYNEFLLIKDSFCSNFPYRVRNKNIYLLPKQTHHFGKTNKHYNCYSDR